MSLVNNFNLENYYKQVALKDKLHDLKVKSNQEIAASRSTYYTEFDLFKLKNKRLKQAKLTYKQKLLDIKLGGLININDLKDEYEDIKKELKHSLQTDSWHRREIKNNYTQEKKALTLKIKKAKKDNHEYKISHKQSKIELISQLNKSYKDEKKNIIETINSLRSDKQTLMVKKTLHKEKKQSIKSDYLNRKKSIQKEIAVLVKIKKDYKASLISPQDKKKYISDEVYVINRKKVAFKSKLDKIENRLFKNLNPAYIYVFPAFIGSFFFTVLPFFFMIIVAFLKMDPLNLNRIRFVGFENFIRLFTKDREFQMAITNTFYFAVITIVALMVITVLFAAWLSKNTRIHNMTQTMVFTPHIASLVSVSILWIAMLNPDGIVNQILAIFGIKGPRWLLETETSLISVAIVTVWKSIGYYVLIIISGLQSIPTYVYEAAKLDKATRFTTFRKITIPLLSPTLVFVFIVKFINSFKVFASIDVMTKGGPVGSSMVLGYKIYQYARIANNYGNAMAASIVLTLMIGTATFINYRYFNKKVVYQ